MYRIFGTNKFVILFNQNKTIMKKYFSFANTVFALALTAFIIGFTAFSQKPKDSKYSFRKEQFSKDDSTSHKRNRDGANWNFDQLDEQMKQLEVQMKQLEVQMKNLDIQIKNLDMAKYQKQLDEAMRKIDMEKIAHEIDESVKKIDWEEMNSEIAENRKSVSKLKMAEVAKEMEQVKANLQKQKAEIKLNTGKINADIEIAMKNARKSVEAAREEIKNLREFTDALEKDGLIDKSKAFKIEVKNGELYINDKKQSKEVSDKYRQYYKKSDFTIDTNEENGIRI